MSTRLRISSLSQEPPLQVGKWLRVQALLSCEEMQQLFARLGNFLLFQVSGAVKEGEEEISYQTFLDNYCDYLTQLEKGIQPKEEKYIPFFSSVMTKEAEALYAIPVAGERRLVKPCKPVIQLQAHRVDYSSVDQKFRSMVFGIESITWGIQFSYPQIYEDPQTKEIHQISKSARFPNTALFHDLRKWMRDYTIPTPFIVNAAKINVPIRLGKECLTWINKHPQLIKKGIQVDVPS